MACFGTQGNVASINSGKVKEYKIETASDGSGTALSSLNLTTVSPATNFYAVIRDSDSFVENPAVSWTLIGSIGTLSIIDGGKSAQLHSLSVGTGSISYSYQGKTTSVSITVVSGNSAPQISITEPMGSDDTIAEDSSFSITWNDSDAEQDASISLYYSTTNTVNCSDQTLISSGISEDADGATGSYSWDTSALSAGTYYVCAVIDDGIESPVVSSWSDPLVINAKPSFSFTTPASDVRLTSVTGYNFEWTDSDIDNDASIQIYLKTTNSGACNTGSLIHSTTEDDATDALAATNPASSSTYYYCAEVSDGVNPTLNVHSPGLTVYRNCVWNGTVDTDWEKPANWTACNSMIPQGVDNIRIPAGGNQPSIGSDFEFYEFSTGAGGGSITINDGFSLTMNGEEVQSSISIIAPAVCSTCKFRTSQRYFRIVDGSTVNLQGDLTFEFINVYGQVLVGDGTTYGTLNIAGGPSEGNWVELTAAQTHQTYMPYGIKVEGTASNNSVISIDGLHATLRMYNNNNGGIHLANYYEVAKLDNAHLERSEANSQPLSTGQLIRIENCANGIFTDSTWDSINFNSLYRETGAPIYAGDCPTSSLVTFTNPKGNWGDKLERNDPNNSIVWPANQTPYTCTWNGSAGSDFFNASNWTNCTNGRGNYPDQFDSIIVPVTTSEISISKNHMIGSIAAGTGGGRINFDSDKMLQIYDGSIQSDVTLKGPEGSCLHCGLFSDDVTIENATLTLEEKSKLITKSGGRVYIGTASNPGHLVANANGSPPLDYPEITPINYYTGGYYLEGVSNTVGNRSSIDLNGIIFNGINGGALEFLNNYEITRFDNVRMTNTISSILPDTYIKITNCNNAVFTDALWQEIDFILGVDVNNIDITGCSSLGVDAIRVEKATSGTNAGFGSALENDPDNVIEWGPE
jgi:hypothetical protein